MRIVLTIGLTLSVFAAATAGQVQIHEFVAKNVNGITDEQNQHEDWIEVANLGATPFDLGGYYLTDDLLTPTKWTVPTGTLIPPGKTLLFWADEDQKQGPLHTNFKLDKEGEEIALVDKDGKTVLDSIKFGVQTADVSTGRMVGAPLWVSYPIPTPRAVNRPDPCGNLPMDALDSRPNPGGKITATAGPKLGQLATYRLTEAPPKTGGMFALAIAPFYLDVGTIGALLVHPGQMALLPITTSPEGATNFPLPVPNVGVLAGVTFYVQAFVHDGLNGGLSAGLITRICP